jgi:hypothetical protein
MPNEVIVHKGRVNTTEVRMGFDVSGDTITSEIRSQPTVDATLLATWDVAFLTDGTDGVLVLTIDDMDRLIDAEKGYMDLKRDISGELVPVFDKPLEVIFRGTVTE